MPNTNDWSDFLEFSHQIGSDPMWIQGAGGNTSYKNNHTMWIKGSGKWLADAISGDIFIEVNLADGCVLKNNSSELRPSIEVGLHTALPHKYVVHAHYVNALSWLVRCDSFSQLDNLLSGMEWAWIPYAKPGADLASALLKKYQETQVNLFLLQNHGLVISSDSISGLRSIMQELAFRLDSDAQLKKDCFSFSGINLPSNLGWRLPKHQDVHILALQPISHYFKERAIFPDQVVFLGEKPLIIEDVSFIKKSFITYLELNGCKPEWAILQDQCVLVPDSFSDGAEELLLCLARIAVRIPFDARINYLSSDAAAELLNWDAEKYRRSLELKD
jgi:rhamnose utilization protein RhaD (predicted bifunctional aldolase and dehydrogenase)